MKTVMIGKGPHNIPSSLKWLAQDFSGDWYAYSQEPCMDLKEKAWINLGDSYSFIAEGKINPDWQSTLREI